MFSSDSGSQPLPLISCLQDNTTWLQLVSLCLKGGCVCRCVCMSVGGHGSQRPALAVTLQVLVQQTLTGLERAGWFWGSACHLFPNTGLTNTFYCIQTLKKKTNKHGFGGIELKSSCFQSNYFASSTIAPT